MAKQYSLGAKCIAEAIGTGFGVYAGESGIANALIHNAKGLGMGFGWIAMCYGLAFFFPAVLLGHISAVLNPAFCLAMVVTGELNAQEFFALAASEFLGAFVGGVLVWVTWIPHFNTVPQPPPNFTKEELQPKTACTDSKCVQTSTQQQQKDRQASGCHRLSAGGLLSKFKHFVSGHGSSSPPHATPPKMVVNGVLQIPIGDTAAGCHLSVIHSHLHDQASNRRLEQLLCSAFQDTLASTPELAEVAGTINIDIVDAVSGSEHQCIATPPHSADSKSAAERIAQARSTQAAAQSYLINNQPVQNNLPSRRGSIEMTSLLPRMQGGGQPQDPGNEGSERMVADAERKKAAAMYQAALIADQNVKLGIFATRPAIYSPACNFIVEFLGTVMLVVGVKLLAERQYVLGGQAQGDEYMSTIQPYYIGLYLVVMILGIGGPTGYAVNPARDLGPRIAHALLPIPNKGPNEWYYAWIPVVAPFIGGPVGAALFLLIKRLN